MGKLLPILLVVVGILAGGGAGFVMRAPPDEKADAKVEKETSHSDETHSNEEAGSTPSFVKLNNQFVVPVVHADNVSALVVLSLTLESKTDATERLYSLEPKIRDVALRVLFDHAYAGGFDGQFTAPSKLNTLRKALLDAIDPIADGVLSDVLITDIIRQDN
ncbi:flagellar basal body-associated protein FliL [uncultured Litoreibacter sp.]|uniref:flagellar basal body-associated FliL family protein n=1 Tax=uncultured Litoreibacter sp. TaxID=1392394 RepID=UPI00260BA5E0|nr:flagellar basal body-associated FliL family protein [uncultured Litoreibacter sp.]